MLPQSGPAPVEVLISAKRGKVVSMDNDCDLAGLVVDHTGARSTMDEPIAIHSISSSIDTAYLSCDNISTKPKLLW